MIINIPVGGSSGASGGGSFIQVYADAPQYIEGKYLRVSLDGTEIYADSIPTNVDALTLQITEAGTYTIAVYASSSASTAEESHTVLVDSLTASPSVRIGTSAFNEESSPSSSISYYAPADSGSIYSSSSYSGSTNANTRVIDLDGSFTPTKSGTVRITFSGTVKGNISSWMYYAVAITKNNVMTPSNQSWTKYQTLTSSSSSEQSVTLSVDIPVESGTTYYIGSCVCGGSSSSVTYSSVRYHVYARSETLSAQPYVKSYAKAIKSVQTGVISSSYSNSARYIRPSAIISPVDVNKSFVIFNVYSSSSDIVFSKLTAPNTVSYQDAPTSTVRFMVIEYY